MFIIRLEWNVDFTDNFRWWYKRKFVLGDKIRLNDNSFMFIVQRQYFLWFNKIYSPINVYISKQQDTFLRVQSINYSITL